MNPMKPDEIRAALESLPHWTRRKSIISRTFSFADFLAAMKFVNRVARAAEKACHHPDIDIRWNRVTLALTTHDAGGLTRKDFELAHRCDRLAERD
ncbi:MAG: 4a-hydroxytetrahydrobiopterin dehydratase [Limisphaerales bacterium]